MQRSLAYCGAFLWYTAKKEVIMPSIQELLSQQRTIEENMKKPKRKPGRPKKSATKEAESDAGTTEQANTDQ
jgi:hypothetical protein